ncbi:MAG: OmpA family protein [Clostridia bacterium]|nr:OmpA family protein [Clostridia bacterium]
MGKVKVEKDTSERWLLTYADLMNLLLIFFIILYAMSQVDAAKFNQLASSLRTALGDSTANTYFIESGNSLLNFEATAPSPVIPQRLEDEQMKEATKEIENIIKAGNLGDKIKVSIDSRGIKISMTAHYLFKSGSALLEADSKPTIQDIGQILKKFKSNDIRIEGHTDTDPINTHEFPSNWELSSSRAVNVLRLLIDKAGISPKQISAVGYGEFSPEFPNDSEINKSRNRRVDIIILKNEFGKVQVGTGTK